jgi:hypothetical protein
MFSRPQGPRLRAAPSTIPAPFGRWVLSPAQLASPFRWCVGEGGRAVTTDSARSGDHRLAVTYAPVAVGRTLMHASGRTLMPDSLGVHPLFDVCSFQTQMVRNRVWGGVTKKYHAKAHPLIGAEIDDHWAGHRPENLLGA